MSGNEFVFRGENNQALTNSLLVAKEFGKSHDNVLKAVRSLISEGVVKNNETPMFEETEYKNWSLFELQQMIKYYKGEVEKLLEEKHLSL